MLQQELEVEKVNRRIQQSLPEEQKELVSDGYHTFKELYAHRVALFVALCNAIYDRNLNWNNNKDVQSVYQENEFPWKSLKHADGTMYDGWFIAGIGLDKGKTLTYHLPISEWDSFLCPEVPNAPEWDGHTSEDVLRLLKQI